MVIRIVLVSLIVTPFLLAAPIPKEVKKSNLNQKDLAGKWLYSKSGNSTGESQNESFEPVLLLDDEGRGSYELVKLKSKADCVLELKPDDGPSACDWVMHPQEKTATRFRCVLRVEGDTLLLIRPLDPVTDSKESTKSSRPTELRKDLEHCVWLEFQRKK